MNTPHILAIILFSLACLGAGFVQEPAIGSGKVCTPTIEITNGPGNDRLDCETDTTCCNYQLGFHPDGGAYLECSCDAYPTLTACCHPILDLGPNGDTTGGATGSCDMWLCISPVGRHCAYLGWLQPGKQAFCNQTPFE